MARARKKRPPAALRRVTRYEDLPPGVDWTHPRVAQILEGAARCFAREGLAEATMAAIAREAEVTKSTIHYYFDHKRALIYELQAYVYARRLHDLEARRDRMGTEPSPTAAVALVVTALSGRRFTSLRLAFEADATRDAEMRLRLGLAHRALETRVAAVLGRAGADPARAGVVKAAVLGLAQRRHIGDDPPADAEDALVDLAAPKHPPPRAPAASAAAAPSLSSLAPSPVVPAHANWFVGLAVPAGTWFAAAMTSAPAHVRRFHPDDLHLTLAFLGRCGEARARSAWETLVLPSAATAFAATLDRLVGMGHPKRPSALSFLLEAGRDDASRLIEAVRAPLLEAAGARADLRPPRPHVTVGRPARGATDDQRAETFAWARAQPPLGVTVRLEEVCLYTWSHDRPTRYFQVIARRALIVRADANS
ncbi:MAG: TetR family transcriptional regulator [Myxococcota bacterium]